MKKKPVKSGKNKNIDKNTKNLISQYKESNKSPIKNKN